jgi:cell division transport system permease protein
MKDYIRKKSTHQLSHVQAIIEGLHHTLQTPSTSFFLVFILAFALFLPAGFYVLWQNTQALHDSWKQSAEISLYLKKSTSPALVSGLLEKLKQEQVVAAAVLVSPDAGMKNFVERLGFEEILTGFKENPLPGVIVVHPKIDELSKDQIVSFVSSLKNLPEVEMVKVDMDWIERSQNLLNLWGRLSFILMLLLSVGSVVVVCYSTYITPEIILKKSQVSRRVLQYQYFWYGLLGGLVALSGINFVLMVLQNSYFTFQGLGAGCGIIFISFGVLLSVVSSSSAIKHS